MEHWLKKFSKNLPQNTFKTIFDTFGNGFGRFWILKIFQKHFEDSTLHGTLGKKKFLEKITPKHVQNTFGQFGNNFGRFWNLENFLNLYKDIS